MLNRSARLPLTAKGPGLVSAGAGPVAARPRAWRRRVIIRAAVPAVLVMATASRPDATAIPITPGGLGITELGLIGILAGDAGHKASAQVTAAVLMYRAVTYLPSIPLGALACLTWRYAPALINASPRGLPGRLASR